MEKTVRSVIRDELRALSAYHVPDSRGLVKLDAMENPYGLPEELSREIGEIAAAAAINRYPDPSAAALRARLRDVMGVPEGIELLLGNGSDELIQILALAVNRPGAAILGVEPSFVMFRLIAMFAGVRYVGVPLREDFSLDAAAMAAAIRQNQPALIFLACPNNPTGNLFDAAEVTRVVDQAPGLVVLDEAYHAFAGRSFLSDLPRHPNLLVMRTLSKLGLAGLRLGVLAGRPEWIQELNKLRLPYNVNVLTQRIAERVLCHASVFEDQAARIRSERARLGTQLTAAPGVRAYPSDANFILLRVAQADAVHAGLRKRGVLIKNLNGSHPALRDCLRVTVGTPGENDQFLAALHETLQELAAEPA